LYNKKVSDINSGYRILRVSKFKGKLNATGMGMVAQITSFALKNNIPFIEVPISYGIRLGKSKLGIVKDGLIIAYTILMEKFRES